MMNHFFLDRRQDGQYTPKNQADGGAAAHSRGVLTRDLAIAASPNHLIDKKVRLIVFQTTSSDEDER